MGEWLIFVAVIMAIVLLGVQFIRGRWLNLIAGNKSSTDSKEGRRTGKIVGTVLLLAALILVLYQMLHFPTWLLYIAVVAFVLVTIVLINGSTELDKKEGWLFCKRKASFFLKD